MDESFQYFYVDEGWGPVEHTEQVPPEKIERFRGKLPDQLLKYWELYGWGSYGKGLFWLVDPEVYDPVLSAWLEDTPLMRQDTFSIIGRSAFGQLFLWGTKSGQSLNIIPCWDMIFPRDNSKKVQAGLADDLVRYFFVGLDRENLIEEDAQGRPLFDRALQTLGPLASDEMYGYVPALALGGEARLENLRKVKAVEHLIILAQLGERTIMRDIVQDAQNAGLM